MNSGKTGQLEDRRIVHSDKLREGWQEAFQKMAERSDDELLDQLFSSTVWDDDVWEWQ